MLINYDLVSIYTSEAMSTDENFDVLDNHQYPQSGYDTGQQGTYVCAY